jgi:hypothetical protein
MTSCGGIFQNSRVEHLGSFALNIGADNALLDELIGVIIAIELLPLKIGPICG